MESPGWMLAAVNLYEEEGRIWYFDEMPENIELYEANEEETLWGLARSQRVCPSVRFLGNGGVKNTKTYEDSKELSGYVLTLQNFDRLIREGVKDGTIIVSENRIETDKTFDL